MLAAGQSGTDGRLEIPQVVHGVEDAEDINAVVYRPFYEALYDVVGVMPVAEQVLGAQQHLLAGPGHRGLELAQALPGVLPQIADAGIESGPAPSLQRPVADRVQFRRDRQHILQAQPGG
jgi:hypothetical protein